MKKTLLNICLGLLLTFPIQHTAQISNQIDSIFSQWQNKEVPGVVAGLIYGDSTQYTKAFGYANLEHQVKHTVQTKFQMGYVSRQFVVYGILVLEDLGKISLEDPIQKYIPDFPEFEHPIRISHLINHSSGLNDHEALKRILGRQGDDTFSTQEALNLIKNQDKLNFIPGTKFSHMTSKTEITLLLEVIKKASGQTITSFAKEHIFIPLQMVNSEFVEDDNSMISNKAYSYQNQDEIFKRRTINFDNVWYSTAQDMLKWYAALTGKSTSKQSSLIQRLDTPVKLTDDTEFDSWWGKLTLGRSFFHMERGLPAYWQFGRTGGYATNVFRFPEQELTSFVLGNNNVYNGMPAMLHANHYIEDDYTEPASITIAQIPSRHESAQNLKKYEGHYWDAERGIARKMEVVGDTLHNFRPGQERGTPMLPLANKDQFQLIIEGDEKIVFNFHPNDANPSYDVHLGDSKAYNYEKYEPISYSEEHLTAFSGSYFTPDLSVVYNFEVEDGQLVATGPQGKTVLFHPVMQNTFRSDSFEFGSIVFTRDETKNTTGFSIFTDGIQNLRFYKINNSVR